MDLEKKIASAKIPIPENFGKNIRRYKELLMKWNKVHNLTGAKNERMLDEFIFDSLYPLSFLEAPKTLLDIGTGAGFPGMILAMALPETEVTLAEPLSKRAGFLQFVKASLGLENVHVERKRAEELPPNAFDLITSRAVTDTSLLMRISEHLRNENTKLLFYKGERVFDEVEESLPHKVIITQNRHYLLIDKELKND